MGTQTDTHASIEEAVLSIEAKLAGAASIIAEARLRRGIEEIIATYSKTEDTHGFVARLRRLLESVDAQYGAPPRAAVWRTDEPPRGVNLWVTIQRTADEREVAIARAAPKPHDNVWYSHGFWLMWKVVAWMPMTAPEPASL